MHFNSTNLPIFDILLLKFASSLTITKTNVLLNKIKGVHKINLTQSEKKFIYLE